MCPTEYHSNGARPLTILKSFEKSAINLLATDVLANRLIEKLCSDSTLVRPEFTGHGYFLTLRFSDLPVERLVLDSPTVNGKAGELLTGFIAFVENRELTLECFAYGDGTVPKDYRDLDITVFI